MNAIFYKLNDDVRKIKKTLSNGQAFDIKARTDFDIYNPILLVSTNLLPFDYFSFDNKFYFINDKKLVAKNVFEIKAHIDVLMTYQRDILSAQAKIISNTKPNTYYNDDNNYPTLITPLHKIYHSDITLSDKLTTILCAVGKV